MARATLKALVSLALAVGLPASTHAGIVWTDFVGGSYGNSAPKPRAIVANKAGYSCIGGRWNRNNAAFSIGSYAFPQVQGQGPFGGFVGLKDPKGRLLWAQTFTSASDAVYDVAIDSQGNCYVAGTFQSANLTVGNTNGKHFVLNNIAPFTGTQISPFFAKLAKKDGTPQWATNLKVPGTGIAYTIMIKRNALYFAGYTDTIDPAAVVNGQYSIERFSLPACKGVYCMLVGKYNIGKGTWEWLQSYGGGTSGNALLQWAGLSPNGKKMYVAGSSDASGIQFGTSVVDASLLQPTFFGVVDTKTGAALDGMVLGVGVTQPTALTVDAKTGAVYLSGKFVTSTTTVGNNAAGQAVTVTSPYSGDAAFVAKYNGDAAKRQKWNAVSWAQAFASATNGVSIRDMVVGPPKQAVSVTMSYNGQQLNLGNGFAFTNLGYNSGTPAQSYHSNVVARLAAADGKVVAASDQVGGPQKAASLGSNENFVASDKSGQLYLFGSTAVTYTSGSASIPYTQATMATCGLPISALAPNSPNVYWAKVSTLDCNKAKCSGIKGCVAAE